MPHLHGEGVGSLVWHFYRISPHVILN